MDRTFVGRTCEVKGIVEELNTTNHRVRIRLTSLSWTETNGGQYGISAYSLGIAALLSNSVPQQNLWVVLGVGRSPSA